MEGILRWEMCRVAVWLGFIAPLLGAAPARVSVVSTVASACGQGVSQEAVQDLAKARLNGAGILVSSVHDATLAIETDCGPVRESGRRRLAVQECVTFSELVNPTKNGERPTLAATWRKCESYTCDRAKCEAARPYEEASIDDFLNYFQERQATEQGALERAAAAARSRRGPSPEALPIFLGIYVMCCLTVLMYWQFRKQHPHYRN
jgi:hypothetical protein